MFHVYKIISGEKLFAFVAIGKRLSLICIKIWQNTIFSLKISQIQSFTEMPKAFPFNVPVHTDVLPKIVFVILKRFVKDHSH